MFAEVLFLEERSVHLDDDFFELGGTSLAAGRLIALMRKEFGCKLSPTDIFSGRTMWALR